MVDIRAFPTVALVQSVAAINIIGHLAAILITFVYFAVFEPRLSGNHTTDLLLERLGLVAGITLCVIVLVGPINTRWVVRLVREVRYNLPIIQGPASDRQEELLRPLVGQLLNLPVKLGLMTLVGWGVGALLFSGVSFFVPELSPWPKESLHKMSAWMILVAAPLTTCWVYFSQELWLRMNLNRMFPRGTLVRVPPSFRINVLPKMLVVMLPMTVVPLLLLSHVTLHQVTEIQAGRQSVENFLNHAPALIWFVTILFTLVAMSLSILLAKSISQPLKDLESGMEGVRSGDMYSVVPVLSNDDIGRVEDGFNRMVEERRELDFIKDTFGRYLSTEVVDEILRSRGGIDLQGKLRDMTILVADIRGFTSLTESLEPHKVLAIVNRFLETMTDIIVKHSGTIDEFTGDGILVFFGAPKFMEDHCLRAVACALEMQCAMDRLNASNRDLGLPDIRAGIGINSGLLIVGNIGSEKRKKYGAVGSPINIAFRIQAEAVGGETVVSTEIVNRLQGKIAVRHKKESLLKGLDKPLDLFCVESVESLPHSTGSER
ncbi:MAG: Adenylate/guanylate cyclase protein [Thermodesulfobacteriota bacterium]|nr:Adenylate/guanylate cyclase protein [Thermodesulfobacteriota bacterium]